MPKDHLARRLAHLNRRIRDMERAQRLRNSAIPQSMPVYADDGSLRMVLGQQEDGSFTTTAAGGLNPPAPSQPVVMSAPLGAVIVWSGLTAAAAGEEPLPDPDPSGDVPDWDTPWVDTNATPEYDDARYASETGTPPIVDPDEYLDELGEPVVEGPWVDPVEPGSLPPPNGGAEFADPFGRWPSDFSHVEIHAAKDTGGGFDPEFVCTDATQVGTFVAAGRAARKSVDGLEADATYWVRLVAVSQSNQESRASSPVSVTVQGDALEAANDAYQQAIDALAAAGDAANFAATKNAVYRQDTKPTGGTYADGDVWFDTTDGLNIIHVYDPAVGDFVETRDSSIATAIQQADLTAQLAAERATTTTSIQTSANGKNKVTYATSAPTPGTTPCTAGDVWFVKTGGLITGHWEGLGGTSWASRLVSGLVLTNLDAGSFTAGTAFTVDLTVKSNFTLGTATTDGVIQSYNYAASPTGVLINKNGLLAKGGTITGATVQATSGGSTGVKMDAAGMRAFNAVTNTFVLDAATGNVTITGAISTGGEVNGATITAGVGGTIQTSSLPDIGIKMNNSYFIAYDSVPTSLTYKQPTFSIDTYTGAVVLKGSLTSGSTISGATVTGVLQTNAGAPGIKMSDSGISIYDDSGVEQLFINSRNGNLVPAGDGEVLIDGALRVYGSVVTALGGAITSNGLLTAQNGLRIGTGGAEIYGVLTCYNNVHGDYVFSDAAAGGGTTAASINDLGRVQRTTSSRRYKDNIVTLSDDAADRGLDVRVVTFTRKDDERDEPRVYVGAIAEEVAELGLDHLVFHNADGDVEGIHYDGLAAVALAVAQRLAQRLDALEPLADRVTQLEAA